MPDLKAEFSARRAWDYSSPRQGGDVLPVVYGDLTDGTGGQWTLPCIDTGARVYAFAGHEVISHTPTIYDKDQNVISASNYTFFSSDDFQGKGAIATVTFSADVSAHEPLGAQGRGRKDESAQLIENPIGIIEDFLQGMAGWQASDIDSTRMAMARSTAEGRGYKAAGVIDRVRTVGDVLSEIMGSCLGSWWLGADGKLKLLLAGDTYCEADVAGRFYESRLSSVKVTAQRRNIVNQAELRHRRRATDDKYQAGLSGSDVADATSQSIYGQRSHTLETPWIRDDDVAAAVGRLLISQHKEARRIVEFEDSSPANVFLEKGDLGLLSLQWLFDSSGRPLVNQIVRIIEVNPNLSRQSTGIKALDTGMYKTVAYLADGTYTAGGQIMAGGERDRTEY